MLLIAIIYFNSGDNCSLGTVFVDPINGEPPERKVCNFINLQYFDPNEKKKEPSY